MGVCAFVASGLEFRMDEYLKGSPFKPYSMFRRGEVPRKESTPRPDTGFALLVSQDEEQDLTNQSRDAMLFLVEHEKELERLRKCGADILLFDFGVAAVRQLQQSVYLPPELIVGMGRFQMAMMFSVVDIPRG